MNDVLGKLAECLCRLGAAQFPWFSRTRWRQTPALARRAPQLGCLLAARAPLPSPVPLLPLPLSPPPPPSSPSLPLSLLCLLCLLLLTLSPLARAAPPNRWAGLSDTLFKHYAPPEAAGGTSFAQDGSGFVWMGTQSGLVRWDGYRFRRYVADARQAGALPDSYIVCLYVDERGRLWAGTSSGGLARYDAERDNFVVYGAGAAGLSSGRVTALAGDGAGGLWVATGAGLDRIDAQGATRRALGVADLAMPEDGVSSLLVERGGAQWLGTSRGLLRRDNAAAPLRPVALGGADAGAPGITQLLQDSAGVVWIGTRAQGAFRVGADGGRPRPVRASATVSLQGERIMAIAEVARGLLWFGTEGGGIVAVDGEGEVVERIRHQADRPDSLQSDDVSALFRERSGLMFVSTTLTMSIQDPRQRAVLSLLSTGVQREPKLSIPSLHEMPDGRIWLGVVGGGIDVLDPLRGQVGRVQSDPVHIAGRLPRGRVLAMASGPGGQVYIGTQQGLYRSDADGDNVERIDVPNRSPNAGVWALAFDGPVLWMGGQDGLWALDVSARGDASPAPGLLRHLSGQLGDLRVTALLRGAGNDLWIGTHAGLARLDTGSGALERVTTDPVESDRLPPGYLSSLLLDRSGRLWVSVFGVGVAVLERTDGDGRRRFRRLDMRDGLPDNGVNKLLEDRGGAIWASTDDGLARIDPRSYAMRVLQRPEGVNVQTYWTNSGLVSRAGELLFGGQTGLTLVLPERLRAWDYRAPLVLSEVQVGGQPLPPARLAPAAGGAARLQLAPGEHSLWVEFATLDYSAPERNRYAYRLDGVDAGWVATDARYRRASYTNLAPGDYTLQLRGSNRDGVWSEPLRLAVRVMPAWYQTWWFLVLLTLCALGLVAAVVHGRTAYLSRRQGELQALVERRTAELRATQSQLEQLAYADPLTGLPNRRLFNDELRQLVALALREGNPFVLLLIDLDHFKRVNDLLGHDAGDALLVEVARRLKQAVREADRVARLGGDEFAVLLSNTEARDSVDVICARIVDSLAAPVPFGEALMQVGASLGAAMCPSQAGAPDALYKAADVALYQAKRGGRNTWRWYAPPQRPAGASAA